MPKMRSESMTAFGGQNGTTSKAVFPAPCQFSGKVSVDADFASTEIGQQFAKKKVVTEMRPRFCGWEFASHFRAHKIVDIKYDGQIGGYP